MADMNALRARIRALRAMTTRNGCTEEEAAAAAVKAAELMNEFGIRDELVDMPPLIEIAIGTPVAHAKGVWLYLYRTVADTCACESWRSRGRDGVKFTYYGFEPDVLIAEYLHEMLARRCRQALREFRRCPAYIRKRSVKTRAVAEREYFAGFIAGLQRLLRDAFREDAPERRWLVALELDRRKDIKLSPLKDRPVKLGFGALYGAGADAGLASGAIRRAADGPAAPLLIGKTS